MTNTLHRYGDERSLKDDYIVFAIPSRGYNDENSVPKLQEFLRLAVKYKPVNLGDGSHGALFRPNKRLTPLAHWFRREKYSHEKVIDGVKNPTTVAAVFDNKQAVEAFVEDLRKANLGLSINISALIDKAQECCRDIGLPRHSVEYSLRFMGKTDYLAEARVLELSTMCGHGMISFNFARKMLDWVKGGRRSPEQASEYLSRFCTCGVYNPCRAIEILQQAQKGQ
jgi:hypothetical protein